MATISPRSSARERALRRATRPRAGRPASPESASLVTAPLGSRQWRAWGTAVTVVTEPGAAIEQAARLVADEIAAFDRACSRFRPDSELLRLEHAAGRPFPVTPLLFDALEHAVHAARATDGAVDPTVGSALVALGYDRDYDEVAAADPGPFERPTGPAPGWQAIELDPTRCTVTLPHGVSLDLGATAKALCADRAAARVARRTGAGVVVDLGGDLAAAGPAPVGGWPIAVVEDGRSGTLDGDCVVAIWGGGLASSGPSLRTWRRDGHQLHHIVDPATGWPVAPRWRQVTVAAGSCVDANAASTAAVVWGEEAPFRLAQMGLPARLVGLDGAVLEIGGWPTPVAP